MADTPLTEMDIFHEIDSGRRKELSPIRLYARPKARVD